MKYIFIVMILSIFLLSGCTTEQSESIKDGKLKANDCSADDRNQPCTKEYAPVCGWFSEDIKCIKYPCAAEFSNKCTACSDEKVAYWTEGKCPTDRTGSEQ